MINTAILRSESIDSIRHTVFVWFFLIILALVIADDILYIQNIPYIPKVMNGGVRGVAFVEAGDHHHAMQTFRQQYAGQYHTVETCEKLFKDK